MTDDADLFGVSPPRVTNTRNCADCGIDTHTINEWYMVTDAVWETAWVGRRLPCPPHHWLPGLEILCIGCLEQRIGRTLTSDDFLDAPVNDPAKFGISKRLLNRLTAKQAS